jgi:SAM-dependent methyltransferase
MDDHAAPSELVPQDGYLLSSSRYASVDSNKVHISLYEKPAMISLLPKLAGRDVLDAYCGLGVYSEHAARQGASVTALDPIPAMVQFTKARCDNLAVNVRQGNLNRRLDWIADAQFDVVISSLALDYVEDLQAAFSELHRVTKPGGSLIFSVTHPMTNWHHVRTNQIENYFKQSLLEMHWCGFDQGVSFFDSYRRPLQDIVNALSGAGFGLDRMLEPQPQPAMAQVAPIHFEQLSRAPCFLCVRAIRQVSAG